MTKPVGGGIKRVQVESGSITIGGVAAGVSIGGSPLLENVEDGAGVSKSAATDILPVVYRNVPSPVTPGTPLAAEVTEIDFTLANHSGKTITTSALVISCYGGANFRGVYISVNTASTSAAATAMATSTAPNTANVAHHKEIFFCPPGITLIPYNEVIGLVHILSADSTTEDNVVQVSPL